MTPSRSPVARSAGVLALATAAAALAAGPAAAADDTSRFDGRAIVVATGDGAHLVDSVSAGPLAAALGTSVVLAEPVRLGASTAARVQDSEPSTVYLIGGSAVVPAQVEADVRAAVPSATVVRLQGDDRYGTANAVSAEVDAFYDYLATQPVATPTAAAASAPSASASPTG